MRAKMRREYTDQRAGRGEMTRMFLAASRSICVKMKARAVCPTVRTNNLPLLPCVAFVFRTPGELYVHALVNVIAASRDEY